MSDQVITIGSESEFRTQISSGVVFIDFFAPWCRPCQMQGPILDQLASQFAGKVKFLKVDTDQFKQLASEFNVSGIPNMAILKDGTIVDRFEGLRQADVLAAALEPLVS